MLTKYTLPPVQHISTRHSIPWRPRYWFLAFSGSWKIETGGGGRIFGRAHRIVDTGGSHALLWRDVCIEGCGGGSAEEFGYWTRREGVFESLDVYRVHCLCFPVLIRILQNMHPMLSHVVVPLLKLISRNVSKKNLKRSGSDFLNRTYVPSKLVELNAYR